MTKCTPEQVAFARRQIEADPYPIGSHQKIPSPVVCVGCGEWAPGFWHRDQGGAGFGYCCTPESEKQYVAGKRAEALIRLGRMPRFVGHGM